ELNLQVFSRGLAAIGDLFVFDGLSFIEGRQSGLLHRRDMNKHVLPTRRGLDKPIALGRIEPLDRTFSHYVVSAGSIKIKRTTVPADRYVRRCKDTLVMALMVAQTAAGMSPEMFDIAAH